MMVGTLRRVAGGDAQLMVFITMADRVVEIKPAIGNGHFRRPKICPERWVGPDHCATGGLPLKKIRRLNHGKNFPDGLAGGFQGAGTNRIIGVAVFPDEWVSKIAGI